MTENFRLITTVLGGLALFVYGMGLMSEGLKETAGEKLKAALGYMTRNRLFAILSGAAVTALVQSSSATSVMTVGFVNAGLLSLEQAIGVIFGANIGTTVTGQIVALKLSDIALPAVTVGVVGLMVAKRSISRGAWRTVLGFGLLFFGMNLMSHELKVLAKAPGFISFFSSFDCTPGASGYLPPLPVLGAIAVGTICTMLVQSSSATIGITIALAETGVISIWTAVPIVLGDNIGTTITAAFAAIGGTANARRTALAHALFNVLGTVLVVGSFAVVVTNASGISVPVFFQAVNACTGGNGFAGEAPGRHVAMAHTLFNLANVVVLSFFIPALARLCTHLVREHGPESFSILEPRLLETPELALQAARRALAGMTARAWTVAAAALGTSLGRVQVEEEAIENAEREIDEMQRQMNAYLVEVSRRRLTERQSRMLPDLVHCVNDAERISDIALKIYRKTPCIRKEGVAADSLSRANELVGRVRSFARMTVATLRTEAPLPEDVGFLEKEIYGLARALSRASSLDGRQDSEGARRGVAFLTILAGVRDISRHIGNIAERASTLL